MTRSTARVAWQDVPFAKGAIWVVCGPVAPLTPELVSRMLNTMAGHGPPTRVGLVPAAGTRRWQFDDRPGDTAVVTDFVFDSDDVNKMLTQMMETSPAVPIQVVAPGGGDYVCMYVDHGVGDAHLIIEMFTALSQAATVGDFVPPVPGSMRTPLLSCFWHAAKADPKGMWSEARDLVKTVAGRRRSRDGSIAQELAVEAPSDSAEKPAEKSAEMKDVAAAEKELPTAVFVKSRVGYTDELRAYRARTQQQASVATLVMRSLYHAFRDCGANVSDDMLVMTDMRRFVPPGRWSLANLSAAVSVSVTPEMSAQDFTAAVFWQAASRKPLMRLMGRAVAARLQGLPAAADVAQAPSQQPRPGDALTLSVSDVSRVPAVAKVSWKPGWKKEDINLAIAVASPDPSYISVLMLNPVDDGAVHLTASFYASRISPELVEAALRKALETPGSPLAP